MTKSEQILALYDGKRTTREIADIVGCGVPYVRVVARQRKGGSMSKHDKKYRIKKAGSLAAYSGLVYRKVRVAAIASATTRQRALRSGHDLTTANALARSAYADERRKQQQA